MRGSVYKNSNEILESTFAFLVAHGLENVSIRELCRGTGISMGSIYYWFDDKEDMVCEAAKYGLGKVADQIFEYAFSKIDDMSGFFDSCLSEIDKYSSELRFIHQMAASPVYGDKVRDMGNDLNRLYDSYGEKLAQHIGCDYEEIRSLVHLFIASVLGYSVWGDAVNTKSQMLYIHSQFVSVMEKTVSAKA